MREQKSEVRGQDRLIKTVHCSLFADNKGIALVMVLILSAISLAIMAGLVYMVVTGTQISGGSKRYKTALEASIGSADVTYQIMWLRGNTTDTDSFLADIAALNPQITTPNTCVVNNSGAIFLPDGTTCSSHIHDCDSSSRPGLCVKLNLPTSCWSSCDNALTIDPATATTYDMRFDFGAYRAYGKIVNSIEGNSEADLGLRNKGVVNSNSGEVKVPSIPYLYTVEVDAENPNNPAERAKLSILYQY